MALGGTPPQLMDQARDGVVDIVWTLPGYTPGRFPRVEVFELPFMMTNAEATSRAYWDLFKSDMEAQEFQGIKILATWVHGPGVIHAKGEGVRTLEDMQGKKLRGPTRVINNLLAETGAEPIGMPVPAIPEALSKGVIGRHGDPMGSHAVAQDRRTRQHPHRVFRRPCALHGGFRACHEPGQV